ncbi:MAG: hypothetical protein KDD42_02440, partial [Bdellovibrionales bacterium]|nr:hypothetical protein [Bdellovibrionales bacterium]
RIEEVEKLLSKSTEQSLFLAQQLLKGNLVFSDGAIHSAGTTHMLPLARLASAIPLLIENLEDGLREIENEIASIRSTYNTSDSGSEA